MLRECEPTTIVHELYQGPLRLCFYARWYFYSCQNIKYGPSKLTVKHAFQTTLVFTETEWGTFASIVCLWENMEEGDSLAAERYRKKAR